MTNASNLITYLKSHWALVSPAMNEIKFSDDWFDADYTTFPQIVIRESFSPKLEQFTTGGSMFMRANTQFAINIGCHIPVGSPGTQQKIWMEDMKRHIVSVFRYGWGHDPQYAGVLNPLRVVLPEGFGRVSSRDDAEPRFLRYIMTLNCTEDM